MHAVAGTGHTGMTDPGADEPSGRNSGRARTKPQATMRHGMSAAHAWSRTPQALHPCKPPVVGFAGLGSVRSMKRASSESGLAAKASLRMRRASPTSPASHFSLAAISHSTSACAKSGTHSQIRQPAHLTALKLRGSLAPRLTMVQATSCHDASHPARIMPMHGATPTARRVRALLVMSGPYLSASLCLVSKQPSEAIIGALPVRGCCEPAATSQPGRLYRNPRH